MKSLKGIKKYMGDIDFKGKPADPKLVIRHKKKSNCKYRRLCGMTLQEIARQLGWSIGSVHSSFKKDRKKFIKIIKNLKAIR